MRLILLSAPLATLLACFYFASPFWSAWMLREAIRQGDTETLKRKVHWPGVRESLRSSLTEAPRVDAGGVEIKPSLWRRTINSVKSAAANRFVDTYMTPEGLPRLYQHRESLRKATTSSSVLDESQRWQDRIAEFYGRLKRAEFQTPTRVEIEIADRNEPRRSYVSVLELVGLEWKLTGLRVLSSGEVGLGLAR